MEGCFGKGETRDVAVEDLRLAMVDFIKSLQHKQSETYQDAYLLSAHVG